MTRRTIVPLLIVAVMCLLAAPAFAQEKPPAMSHDTAGKDNCLMCHTSGTGAREPCQPHQRDLSLVPCN